ncbi:unnamed protein product [Pipistrellus nathusii]|uniref:Uncharacterized protein n=1 Tax=Pipistrellus nathusii TaxID=59473 RepID=A0ABP0AEE4_PIPNA
MRRLQSLGNSVGRAGACRGRPGLGLHRHLRLSPFHVCLCARCSVLCSPADSGATCGHVGLPAYTDLGVQSCTARWVCVHPGLGVGGWGGVQEHGVCPSESADIVGQPKIFLFFAA